MAEHILRERDVDSFRTTTFLLPKHLRMKTKFPKGRARRIDPFLLALDAGVVARTNGLRLNQSVDRYMRFLEREQVETVKPWMDAALRAVNGSFTPAAPGEIRNFFQEVIYRDPDAFRPHMHHWIDLARMREEPHPSPIRRVPSLSNIYDHRSEGHRLPYPVHGEG